MHRIIDTTLFYSLNNTGNGFTNYKWLLEPTPDYWLREPTLVDATTLWQILNALIIDYLEFYS